MKGHEYVAHGTLYDGDHLEGSGHSCWNCFRTGIADGSLEIARAQAPESRSREAGLCDLINQNSINCGGAKNSLGRQRQRRPQATGSRPPRTARWAETCLLHVPRRIRLDFFVVRLDLCADTIRANPIRAH